MYFTSKELDLKFASVRDDSRSNVVESPYCCQHALYPRARTSDLDGVAEIGQHNPRRIPRTSHEDVVRLNVPMNDIIFV